MRAVMNAQCFLVFALYVAQIMQMYGDRRVDDVKHGGYEIFKVDEYVSLVEKQDRSDGKVVVDCNFDNDWCGFQNMKRQDNFNWTLTNGRTPSRGTGPTHDISGTGSYIYIEASYPRVKYDTARLTSPVIPPMVYCLRFGFHAWGGDIGKLVVYKKGLDGEREEILHLERSHGRNWHFVFVTVVHASRFVIEFEGVCGGSYRGDIALDNITLTEGGCISIQSNNTGVCGTAYPGFTKTIPGFPAYYSWPWLVWITSPHSQPSCSAVQVGSNWLLTTRDCTRRFSNDDITAYAASKKKRRNVLKNAERFLNAVQPVLLKLKNSTSRREAVCLPSNIHLQNRVTDCRLLGLSTLGFQKSFVELPATILSTNECRRHIKLSSKTSLDVASLVELCARVNSSFSFNDSQLNFGYLVCKNKIMNNWILHGMSRFSKQHFRQNILVLRRVSFDVDWIENITKDSYKVHAPPKFAGPTTTRNPLLSQGFQIMERAEQKCLTLDKDILKFTYTPCNDHDIMQRFKWSQDHRLVVLVTNSCVQSDGTHLHFLRPTKCIVTRRSQRWICEGNTIRNHYYNRYISSKPYAHSGLVRMTRIREDIGHFLIYGTRDNLCSLRPTVKGVMTCDFDRHRTCGFDGVDSYAQFMWIVPRTGSTDYQQFPGLLMNDKFFRVIRRTNRGTPVAVLRSQPFHGQQCAEFRVIVHGSTLNQLKVYKDGGGESKLMFQKYATRDMVWRFHRVTLVPSACEAFQVVFEAVFSNFSQSKVAIRDIVISPGACRSVKKHKGGVCLKDWKLVNGQCLYFHDSNVTWHEASAVCRIADAQLITQNLVSEIIPRGRLAWLGVRSCPTGKLYSVDGVPHQDKSRFTTSVCMTAKRPPNGAPSFQTSQCDLNLPFACQKDPVTTRSGCGGKIEHAPYDQQYPWHVLIVVRNTCVCGGTLVAPGHVVTSTLCLSRIRLYDVTLFFPSSRKLIRKFTRIIDHSESGVKSGDKDLSMVIFEDDDPSTPCACLMKTSPRWTDDGGNFLQDKTCVVLGWGTFKGSDRACSAKNYRIHEVDLVDRKECREYYGSDMITERMICARSRNETVVDCLGDTGGPLVCEISGLWTLVGVTSWGIGCSPTRKYGIYTDVGSMKPWIDTVLRENQHY